jgi:RNA polymerase sigma factor for flagellar operon FliA
MLPAQVAYKEQQEQQRNEDQDREQLIMGELPTVYYIARRIHERLPQQVPLEDLVSAGVVGLIEAVRSYDSGKSVPFKSFAKFRIRGAILDNLRELDWGSRLLRHNGRQVEEAISKLSKTLGRQPEAEEIAAELNISIDKLYEITRSVDGAILVGQQVNSTYDRSEKQDLIESAVSRDENPFELCAQRKLKRNSPKPSEHFPRKSKWSFLFTTKRI